MAGQDRVLLVDHDRDQPAELAHASRDLLDLAGVVAAGIAAVDLEILDGAVLDYRREALARSLRLSWRGSASPTTGWSTPLWLAAWGALLFVFLTMIFFFPRGSPLKLPGWVS